MSLRRRRVMSGLTRELERVNLSYQITDLNKIKISGSNSECLVSCASRPPDIGDFYELAGNEIDGIDQFRLIYPKSHLSEVRRGMLDWVRKERNLDYSADHETIEFVASL